MITFDEEDQGWRLLKSEDDLLWQYPEHVRGNYMPQPFFKPERYPCYFREIAIIDNRQGPDHAMLAYIYPEQA